MYAAALYNQQQQQKNPILIELVYDQSNHHLLEFRIKFKIAFHCFSSFYNF